jgi:hypothetical protein
MMLRSSRTLPGQRWRVDVGGGFGAEGEVGAAVAAVFGEEVFGEEEDVAVAAVERRGFDERYVTLDVPVQFVLLPRRAGDGGTDAPRAAFLMGLFDAPANTGSPHW